MEKDTAASSAISYSLHFGDDADVSSIRRFRYGVYAQDGLEVNSDYEIKDYRSYHVLAYAGAEIVGCIRYTPSINPCDPLLTDQVGGWAVRSDYRHTSVSIALLLWGYKIGQRRGGATVLTEATVRHGSAGMMERMGGLPAGEYFSHEYGCMMRDFYFDTANPPAKYRRKIASLTEGS